MAKPGPSLASEILHHEICFWPPGTDRDKYRCRYNNICLPAIRGLDWRYSNLHYLADCDGPWLSNACPDVIADVSHAQHPAGRTSFAKDAHRPRVTEEVHSIQLARPSPIASLQLRTLDVPLVCPCRSSCSSILDVMAWCFTAAQISYLVVVIASSLVDWFGSHSFEYRSWPLFDFSNPPVCR